MRCGKNWTNIEMIEKPRSEHGREAEFLAAARDELERGCERLDGHTLSRLNRIRHAALERPGARRRALLAPFGGLVTASVLALVVVMALPNRNQETAAPVPADPDLAIEDLEILTSEESLDFYADFEFYQWLADNGSSI